jgi:2-polyprenyl-3-methyl-5-hydroxy-6-metoxy-1,4-benzoquinol methylase
VNDPAVGGDLAAKYDTIPYAAQPNPASHPAHLAAVATLFGLDPPAVHRCRTLEVGCSDGANLIPMAVSLPEASFVGFDLAARPTAAAQATVAELGLANIRFAQQDLAALPADIGTFDYIVAHGVYSWVPAPVRDARLALASQHLAPDGVMLARWQAKDREHVTNLRHETVRIADASARAMLALLDGEHDRAQLAAALGPASETTAARIEQYLQAFARLASLRER